MTEFDERLRAAIDETERIARAPQDGSAPWTGEWSAGKDGEGGALYTRNGWYLASKLRGEPIEPGVLAHIVHNDPAAVLRRVAADRKLLALHEIRAEPPLPSFPAEYACVVCDHDREDGLVFGPEVACPTVLALAEGYGIEPTPPPNG